MKTILSPTEFEQLLWKFEDTAYAFERNYTCAKTLEVKRELGVNFNYLRKYVNAVYADLYKLYNDHHHKLVAIEDIISEEEWHDCPGCGSACDCPREPNCDHPLQVCEPSDDPMDYGYDDVPPSYHEVD